jgi:hypothetical protein
MENQADTTAKLADLLHEIASMQSKNCLSDKEQDILRTVEHHMLGLQAQVDDLRCERADYLAPADPQADRACPFCGGTQVEGDPSERICSHCYASGPDENAPNGFKGDWNSRAVPPGAEMAECLRRLTETVSMEAALSAPAAESLVQSQGVLARYDAVAAQGRPVEKLSDEESMPRSLVFAIHQKRD